MEQPEVKTFPDFKPTPSTSKHPNHHAEDDEGAGLCLCGKVTLTLLIALVTSFILLALVTTYPSAPSDSPKFNQTCNKSEEFRQNLYALTRKVHGLLDKQALKHFLCYDALWGSIENRGLLPWTDKVEICMEKEHLAKKCMKDWVKDFGNAKLSLRYSWQNGLYTITDPEFQGGAVQLIIFKEEPKSKSLIRTGWNYYRWEPDCREKALDCFHPYLVDDPPLRMKLFGDFKMPVPHFNEVIQKYHYPNTWQEGSKATMPQNC